MDKCDLCNIDGMFKLTICRTCDIPMIVATEHQEKFSEEEKRVIERLFKNIRWEMRTIKDHAHCHLVE